MTRRGCFQDIRLFVTCYGILILTDIMAGVMKKSSLTTIERRFNLPTTTTALLASSFQIGTLTTLLFVSYFGSRWHRPRGLFLGSVLLVLGNLVATLPQFIGERYKYEDISSNATLSTQVLQCSENATSVAEEERCGEDEKHPANNLYVLLIIGMMLNGVGGSAIQPLGVSYIDDYAHERNSPLYLGITTSIGLVGPIVGYVLSSVVLRWWVDIGWIDTSTVSIKPTHPNWVGAWWLGLLICTTGIAITMVPFIFFPKNMKAQQIKENKKNTTSAWEKQRATAENPVEATDGKMKGSIFGRESRGFFETLKRVLSNVIFILFVAKFYFGSASLVGLINFFPKYLEVGFGVSAARANFLTGVINVPCAVIGTLLGGAIMKRLNLTPLGTIKLIAVATVLGTLCFAPLIFVGCDTIDIAGITVPYSDGSVEGLPNAESTCNMNCNCADGTYNPVCGSDGISYISPCHAGCTDTNMNEGGLRQSFSDCGCITQKGSNGQQNITWATPERCEFSKCYHLIPLVLGLKSAAHFFLGLAGTPLYISLMRCVDKQDKAFAVGLNLMLVRLLAWIPGPLIYGAVIDSACTYWGKKPCTDQAYCKVYDNNKYRHRFYSLNLVYNIMSCVTIFVLFVVVKRRQNSSDESKSDIKSEQGQDLEAENGDAVKSNGEHHNLLSDKEADPNPNQPDFTGPNAQNEKAMF